MVSVYGDRYSEWWTVAVEDRPTCFISRYRMKLAVVIWGPIFISEVPVISVKEAEFAMGENYLSGEF